VTGAAAHRLCCTVCNRVLPRQGAFVNEDKSLRRYSLRPTEPDLDQIREMLVTQAVLERQSQGDGDTALMKLCCVQLFNAGNLHDVPIIWRAKESSFDAHCSIDVQLLCGAGLAETKAYLAADRSENASAALDYLLRCEAAGDFADFSVKSQSRWYSEYLPGLTKHSLFGTSGRWTVTATLS
jgi:hypothetical protein